MSEEGMEIGAVNGVCFEVLIDQRGGCELLRDKEEGTAKQFVYLGYYAFYFVEVERPL